MSSGIQFNEAQIAKFQGAFLLYDNCGDGKIPVSFKSETSWELYDKILQNIGKKSIDWCDWTN